MNENDEIGWDVCDYNALDVILERKNIENERIYFVSFIQHFDAEVKNYLFQNYFNGSNSFQFK